jgi:ubiquinone/menaquinone biosynthesis C-methylase UbiE
MSDIIKRSNRFNNIYLNSSCSGNGSYSENTILFRQTLLKIIKEYNILSILDLACGNYISVKDIIDNSNIKYIGADISIKIIEHNQKKYPQQQFICLDAITSDLSMYKCDLIIFRHVIQHLNYKDAIKSIDNIYKSKAKYLMINHQRGLNTNIDKNVQEHMWENQMYNLNIEPFNLINKEILYVKDYDKHVIDKGQEECYSLYIID